MKGLRERERERERERAQKWLPGEASAALEHHPVKEGCWNSLDRLFEETTCVMIVLIHLL